MTCRIAILASVLLGAGATLGCGASPTTAPTTVTTIAGADTEASSGLREHHRYHHRGGVMLFIAMSVDTLGVPDAERRAVAKIRAALHARMQPARDAEQNLSVTLAEGVAASKIDVARVNIAVAQLSAAAGAAQEASVDALNELHAALTTAERAALVDKVNAHWAVWRKANADGRAAQSEGGHVALLAAELGFTQDQLERVQANLGAEAKALPQLDAEEITTQLRAFGDGFRSASFDARTFIGGSAEARLVGWGAAHLAHVVEAASPVLTPEQRATLARRLREEAPPGPTVKSNR
jgi:Spy/CpxP family protein refolding chaperone